MFITSARPTKFFIFALFLGVFYQHTITAANLQENAGMNREDDETLDNIVFDAATDVSCQFNVLTVTRLFTTFGFPLTEFHERAGFECVGSLGIV